ncbi:CAAX protease family (YdiL) [Eupransor demetentiae]|uniref:CAAX protease family (YdiL) n=2 Tax=Eupransor demetentiae TaxID=3109584 RepID=A0ABM9N691_9LACO|nr:CAAX protease family (YdiL) [Lactobacillaceae bacterium LMG 33000]
MDKSDNLLHRPGLLLQRIIIFLVFFIIGPFAASLIDEPFYNPEIGMSDLVVSVAYGIIIYVGFIAFILYFIRQVNPDLQFKFINFRNWRKAIWIVVVYLASSILGTLWDLLRQLCWPQFYHETSANQSILNEMTKSNGWISFVAMFVGACFLAPVIEELIFRGLFMTYFDCFKAFWIGPILSGIAFGIYHMDLTHMTVQDWLDVPTYAIMGLGFAYVYKSSGRISNSIAAHSFNNIVAMILGAISSFK